MTSGGPLEVWRDRNDALLRLRLSRPKANIVDAEMISALDIALKDGLADVRLKGILLDADGPHFSFGASVPEHLPKTCAEMIHSLDGLLLRMVRSPVPILVASRGQCLGGGLEVASAGHLIFAGCDSRFGQPEIQLGVFAAAASCLLPERIGRQQAEDLLISGRTITAAEALGIGLVHSLNDDPEAAALQYFDDHLAPRSASSIRFAVRAARVGFLARVDANFRAVESLYLDGLMSTHDAVEGLEAFLDKRQPQWQDA